MEEPSQLLRVRENNTSENDLKITVGKIDIAGS